MKLDLCVVLWRFCSIVHYWAFDTHVAYVHCEALKCTYIMLDNTFTFKTIVNSTLFINDSWPETLLS